MPCSSRMHDTHSGNGVGHSLDVDYLEDVLELLVCLKWHTNFHCALVKHWGFARLLKFLQHVEYYEFMSCAVPLHHGELLSVRHSSITHNNLELVKVSTLFGHYCLVSQSSVIILSACLESLLIDLQQGECLHLLYFLDQLSPVLAFVQLIVYIEYESESDKNDVQYTYFWLL